jgi:hypothetical protein
MESLTVTAMAGLGNRLMALTSALAIGREMGIPVKIIWTPSYECRIGFDDLFEPLPNVQRGTEGVFLYPTQCGNAAQFDALPKTRNMHIITYIHFYKSPNLTSILRELKPRQEFVDKVSALFGDKKVVGVQIRRTDNEAAIRHSPTELFLNEMATYPSDTYFFLATDSEFEKVKLKDAYGSRILTFNAPLNRGTMEGMRAGFTDFLALSRCSEILASFHSSFSEKASELGDVPMRVVKLPE